MIITASTTNDLQKRIYVALQREGKEGNSRNGKVLYMPEPVTLKITRPLDMVNQCSVRDANPFFHLMEALAMLGSYNSVDYLAGLASNMRSFSDDGVSFNAFYGERLRRTWGDQLDTIIKTLKEDPESRQAVAQIWDARDLGSDTKDRACNLNAIFSIVDNKLRMTTTNRSNDAIWGIGSGANMVHFPFFMWYVASGLGLKTESWYHFTNNLHVYTDNPKWEALKYAPSVEDEPFFQFPLFKEHDRNLFDKELAQFNTLAHTLLRSAVNMKGCDTSILMSLFPFRNVFLKDVAVPMVVAFCAFKRTGIRPTKELRRIDRDDWRIAATRWIDKRLELRAQREIVKQS